MKILTIDSEVIGVEYVLMDMGTQRLLARGTVGGIGSQAALHTYYFREETQKHRSVASIPDQHTALRVILNALADPNEGVLASKDEIAAVAHRVAHGGQKYAGPAVITPEVLEDITEYCDFAPLHNPYNLLGIKAAQKLFPGIPQVVIFDTAFHHTLPPQAYLYGLPYEYYTRMSIRRYGFHGITHRYAAERTAALMGKPLKNLRIITCHLGYGCSIAAIKGGKSIDTSMGFSPLEGVMMATRSGDIDPEVLIYLVMREDLTLKGVSDLISRRSGILGLAGKGTMEDVLEKARQGEARSALALEVFSYRIRKYIGAYTVALGGLDAIALTARLSEAYPALRAAIFQGLECVGAKISPAANRRVAGGEGEISTPGSKVKVFCVPCREERRIAQIAFDFLKSSKRI
jgi:acetate kinase